MTHYVAFLRGVNVGGHNLLKMGDLCRRFISLGFDDVTSYKQSGNIIFEASGLETDLIREMIENELREHFKVEIKVFIRTVSRMKEIEMLDPFNGRMSKDSRSFVTFLYEDPSKKPSLPMRSPKSDVEVILINGAEVFSLAYIVNGSLGDSNKLIESSLGVSVTTRNWATVKGIAML